MTAPRLEYEIFIQATPDRIWEALTRPEQTRRYYYNSAIEADWQPGAPYAYRDGAGRVAAEGTVLEVEPSRRLVTTFAARFDPEASRDRPARVTWAIAPMDEGCRLTVVFDDFDCKTRTYRLLEGGFPPVLTGLKNLLERDGRPPERVALTSPPEIVPLTPERLPDYLRFFDQDAFQDNPAWAGCYCLFHHIADDGEWQERSAADNRRDVSQLITAGRSHGYLAYAEGRPMTRPASARSSASSSPRPTAGRGSPAASSTPPARACAPRGWPTPKPTPPKTRRRTPRITTGRWRCTWRPASRRWQNGAAMWWCGNAYHNSEGRSDGRGCQVPGSKSRPGRP